MRYIIAIGGGRVFIPCKPPETKRIDQSIMSLVEGKHPRFLFVPTALRDNREYCNTMMVNWRFRLGCRYDHLRLIKDLPSEEEIARKIDWADIVYVGGGSTQRMMEVWKETGVDVALKKAYLAGKILAGISAGAICWFRNGVSDSESYVSSDWKPMWVNGLGIIDLSCCPHFDSEPWRKEFIAACPPVKPVIGIEDNAAIILRNEDEYKIISSQPNRKAFLLRGEEEIVLPADGKFRPLENLC